MTGGELWISSVRRIEERNTQRRSDSSGECPSCSRVPHQESRNTTFVVTSRTRNTSNTSYQAGKGISIENILESYLLHHFEPFPNRTPSYHPERLPLPREYQRQAEEVYERTGWIIVPSTDLITLLLQNALQDANLETRQRAVNAIRVYGEGEGTRHGVYKTYTWEGTPYELGICTSWPQDEVDEIYRSLDKEDWPRNLHRLIRMSGSYLIVDSNLCNQIFTNAVVRVLREW